MKNVSIRKWTRERGVFKVPGSRGALPVPKAKTGATDLAAPSETALSGEVKEKEFLGEAEDL